MRTQNAIRPTIPKACSPEPIACLGVLVLIFQKRKRDSSLCAFAPLRLCSGQALREDDCGTTTKSEHSAQRRAGQNYTETGEDPRCVRTFLDERNRQIERQKEKRSQCGIATRLALREQCLQLSRAFQWAIRSPDLCDDVDWLRPPPLVSRALNARASIKLSSIEQYFHPP
jgi:hypothetical protein